MCGLRGQAWEFLGTCTLCVHGKRREDQGRVAGGRCPRERKKNWSSLDEEKSLFPWVVRSEDPIFLRVGEGE